MRIKSVTAHAFGPLVCQTQTFAPGMTVVTGVNESAKSSWHAAITAAIVGRRRGKGSPTKDERRFSELHRPWDSSNGWRVSAIVALDDGRQIELSHDLDGKVDCRATDLALGHDVSSSIMFDGAPDGSRFLGLDRKSFAATAVVNQAELLGILAAAGGLQQHLQRAAATAGSDETAAAALAALEKFRSEHVGLDRANSSRPLRVAKARLEAAREVHRAVLIEHAAYLRLVSEVKRQQGEADTAAREAEAATGTVALLNQLAAGVHAVDSADAEADRLVERAAAAGDHAGALEARVGKAQALHARLGDIVPASVADTDATATTTAAALAAWETAPAPAPLTGASSEQLRRQLDELPFETAVRDGDLVPADTVVTALHELTRAEQRADAHASVRPPRVEPPATSRPFKEAEAVVAGSPSGLLEAAIATGVAELRELAARLESAEQGATGDADSDIAGRLAAAQEHREQAEATLAAADAREDQTRRQYEEAVGAPGAQPTARATPPSEATRGSRAVLFAIAALAGAAGILLLVLGHTPAGLAVLGVAAGGAVLAARAERRTPAKTPQAVDRLEGVLPGPDANVQELSLQARDARAAAYHAREAYQQASRIVAELQGRTEEARAHAERSRAALDAMHQHITGRGLPTDAHYLRVLASSVEASTAYKAAVAQWQQAAGQHAADVSSARDLLRARLQERDPSLTVERMPNVLDAFQAYEHACTARAAALEQANRRFALEQALRDRTQTEAEHARAVETRDRAAQAVLAAAALIGGDSASPADDRGQIDEDAVHRAAGALREWRQAHSAALKDVADAQQQWAELTALLDGSTLDQLEADLKAATDEAAALRDEAKRAEQRAAEQREALIDAAAGAGLDPAVVENRESVTKTQAQALDEERAARERHTELAAQAENAAGTLSERARSMTPVPEAEEALIAAEAELTRVTSLAHTLELTAHFLTEAQDRVHRDIAPVLTATLRQWLPDITAGRYVDAIVDPATLAVKVTGPDRRWREADRVSIGTAEQVYLLLRVALAQHLTMPGESCPLLLDDVTVQADAERTEQILNLLLRLSDDRQVILFAQEAAVAAWAAKHLTGRPEHAIIELPQIQLA